MKNIIPAFVLSLVLALPALAAETPASANKAAPAATAPAKACCEKAMKMDTDGDGKVSKIEMTKAATDRAEARFVKLDTNKDGFVTREEMQAARKDKRAKKPMGEGQMQKQPAPPPAAPAAQ